MKHRIAFNRMALPGKLPPGDPRWREFTDSWDNLTLEPLDIANFVYQGYAFTTWHNGPRKLDNFICGQHIAVDMDTEDERSSFAALEAHPWVRMYGALLYTTPTHSADRPRARVLFLLDSIINNADAYSEAARFVTAQFDGADEGVHDASRFFYGSRNCELHLPGNVLPLAHLRRFYRKDRAQHAPVRPPTPIVNLPEERERRAGQQGLTDLEKARAALLKVNPWGMDYLRWIGVLAALRREFGDAALPLAVEWAQGKPGEVERKWPGLDTEHSTQTTLGTVYYMAAGGR